MYTDTATLSLSLQTTKNWYAVADLGGVPPVFGDSIVYWALKQMAEVTHITPNYYSTQGVHYHNFVIKGAKTQKLQTK